MLTVGVEEEFLLLKPDGAAAPLAPQVLALAGADGRIMPEYWTYQVETATRVCTRLEDVRSELVALRLLLAQSAERAGARLVAAGRPPLGAGRPEPLTDDARYRELARRFPDATAAGATCACHVHVGVPDRDLAVEVLARLRPWLATLLALTANSPFADRADTGWSSARYRALLRWPTFRPPGAWAGADRYDLAVRQLIARGAAMDPGSVYFLARLSARYPTVEVRVADACLTADDAVIFAGVVRALVASLIEDARRGTPPPPVSRTGIQARLLVAARHGLPRRGAPQLGRASADRLIARLLTKITPALTAAGDTDAVRDGLDRLVRTGTGADRQRDMWARTGKPAAFVAALADATAPVPALV